MEPQSVVRLECSNKGRVARLLLLEHSNPIADWYPIDNIFIKECATLEKVEKNEKVDDVSDAKIASSKRAGDQRRGQVQKKKQKNDNNMQVFMNLV